MPGRLAVSMVVGALGVGLAGCGGCDCGNAAAPNGKAAAEAEVCSGLNSLSTTLGPVRAISPSMTGDEVMKLRTVVDVEGLRIDKRGFVSETVRSSMSSSRSDFLLAVDHFGVKSTVGTSGAAVLNEPYQAVKGHLRVFQGSIDCNKTGG